MPTNINNVDDKEESAIVQDDTLYNKKIQPIPKPKSDDESIGDKGIASKIVDAGAQSLLDTSALNSFTQISQTRDQLYQLLDTMGDDPTVSAVLETYAEDATEYNENGKIIWVESDDADIGKYITFLLNSMKVDKNAYKWAYQICKYGDIYWQLFKTSEYNKDEFFDIDRQKEKENDINDDLKERQSLKEDVVKEDVKINLYKKGDHYVHYIEAVSNPAEVFELTKFGKTAGFIKTDITTIANNKNTVLTSMFQYKFKKSDVNIYNSDKFVHAALEDNSSRVPEEVSLFRDDAAYQSNNGTTYTVKRGQSLLYNVYKIWRELSLLENSMLLNRVTKSSILRIISVEIGDMPKEDVRGYLAGIKELIEQKTAVDENTSMGEYTNPGPMENNIYVPTKNGQGAISTSEVGGDVNVGQLPDIDYFTNKYYGALRVPKQYFGFTDDAAGFNGGTSLSIISSRYAKAIKRIQNTLIQGITDIINLMLIDKGLQYYLGKFTIKMQAPTTQEEIDRRDNLSNKLGIIRDTMDLVSNDVEEPATRLKILKILLANVVSDSDITDLLEEEIDKLEKSLIVSQDENEGPGLGGPRESGGDIGGSSSNNEIENNTPLNLDSAIELDNADIGEESEEESGNAEDNLPTPEELSGGDFTDNELEI